jgi:hypothetical protein
MPIVWAAKCKTCGRLSAVRDSVTGGRRIEFPDPYRMTKVECPHCKAENGFSDAELTEIPAEILPG